MVPSGTVVEEEEGGTKECLRTKLIIEHTIEKDFDSTVERYNKKYILSHTFSTPPCVSIHSLLLNREIRELAVAAVVKDPQTTAPRFRSPAALS